jgi:hypothetical protein
MKYSIETESKNLENFIEILDVISVVLNNKSYSSILCFFSFCLIFTTHLYCNLSTPVHEGLEKRNKCGGHHSSGRLLA